MLSSIDFRLNIQGTPLKGSDRGVFSKDCPGIGGKSPRSPRLLRLSLTSRLSPALHRLLPEPVATSVFSKCWHLLNGVYVLCLVAQSCLTLCDPMDCSPPVCSVRGDSPAKNTGVGCHALLQGIFPAQGSNLHLLHLLHLLHYRWILHCWATREAPI